MNSKRAFIPDFVLHNRELTATAKIIYGGLTTLCDRNGVAKVTYRDLAVTFGYGVRTVSHALHLLREQGYITSLKNSRGIKINLSKSEILDICDNRGLEQYAKTV